jgi:hypothetical protein
MAEGKYIRVDRIGPLRPFLFGYCNYEGTKSNIVLYGTDWYSTWEYCRDQLGGLTYEGEVQGYYNG